MITYDYLLYLWFTNVVGRFHCAQPYSQAIHSELLAGDPLEGSAVDVPPSIAVTTVFFWVAGCARKVWSLNAHGERDGSSFTHRHKSKPPQDWSYGYDIQDLWLHPAFVNYFTYSTYDLLMIYLWFTYYLLMQYLWSLIILMIHLRSWSILQCTTIFTSISLRPTGWWINSTAVHQTIVS